MRIIRSWQITAEFSSIEDILVKAKDIEVCSRYDIGLRVASDIIDVTQTAYKPTVRTSKPMFYQQQKTSGPVQRNLKPVSRPQTTAEQVTVTLIYQAVHEHLQKKVNSIVMNVDKKVTLNHNAPSLRANSELPERK